MKAAVDGHAAVAVKPSPRRLGAAALCLLAACHGGTGDAHKRTGGTTATLVHAARHALGVPAQGIDVDQDGAIALYTHPPGVRLFASSATDRAGSVDRYWPPDTRTANRAATSIGATRPRGDR